MRLPRTGTLPAPLTGKHHHELSTWKSEIRTASARPLVHIAIKTGVLHFARFVQLSARCSHYSTIRVMCLACGVCCELSARMEVPPIMETTLPTRAAQRYTRYTIDTPALPLSRPRHSYASIARVLKVECTLV